MQVDSCKRPRDNLSESHHLASDYEDLRELRNDYFTEEWILEVNEQLSRLAAGYEDLRKWRNDYFSEEWRRQVNEQLAAHDISIGYLEATIVMLTSERRSKANDRAYTVIDGCANITPGTVVAVCNENTGITILNKQSVQTMSFAAVIPKNPDVYSDFLKNSKSQHITIDGVVPVLTSYNKSELIRIVNGIRTNGYEPFVGVNSDGEVTFESESNPLVFVLGKFLNHEEDGMYTVDGFPCFEGVKGAIKVLVSQAISFGWLNKKLHRLVQFADSLQLQRRKEVISSQNDAQLIGVCDGSNDGWEGQEVLSTLPTEIVQSPSVEEAESASRSRAMKILDDKLPLVIFANFIFFILVAFVVSEPWVKLDNQSPQAETRVTICALCAVTPMLSLLIVKITGELLKSDIIGELFWSFRVLLKL
eukprot:CAMPEP_0170076938 /NCGR_PEP_ID=MMETSP0019_2-20121128/13852_1 /TAXON_ID=98059 /ORGANISM="Dinobryon sp., Strain UTEXLB2267" /LENGTH=418 /DNA_ID=CAMNT_0010288961 /DNA_START=606 /DNA_END=1862 /DNA_ORIENTATION=-